MSRQVLWRLVSLPEHRDFLRDLRGQEARVGYCGARGGGGDHRRFHLYQHDERVRAQRTCDPACLILRTSRFFPEPDDRKEIREGYEDANAKVNEFLYRCVDLEDVVDAHLLRPG